MKHSSTIVIPTENSVENSEYSHLSLWFSWINPP